MTLLSLSRRMTGAMLAALLLAGAPASADESVSRSLTAEARLAPMMQGMKAPAEKQFDFGTIDATLRSDGSWEVHGGIEHTGILCATYEIGVRFGKGNPGCEDVFWLGEPQFVTSRKQCNSAIVEHSGGDVDPGLGGDFQDITCAERVIRCTGRCIGGK